MKKARGALIKACLQKETLQYIGMYIGSFALSLEKGSWGVAKNSNLEKVLEIVSMTVSEIIQDTEIISFQKSWTNNIANNVMIGIR